MIDETTLLQHLHANYGDRPRIAALAGTSRGMVTQMLDGQRPLQWRVLHAQALLSGDPSAYAACLAELGCAVTPLPPAPREHPLRLVTRAAAALGLAAGHVEQATDAGSPGGGGIEPAEWDVIEADCRLIETELARLRAQRRAQLQASA